MADRFKHLPDIATTQPDRLIKYRISDDRFSAEVLLPGLWYTDFDKKIGGKVTLFAVLKFVESIRFSGLMHGFAYYPELCHGTNKTLFVAGHSIKFVKKFNELTYKKHFGICLPMKAFMTISQIGNSSYTNSTRIFDSNSGDLMLSFMTKIVYVDKNTRKPTPLSQPFLDYKKEFLQNTDEETLTRMKQSAVPPEAYEYRVKVLHSDCDLNMHVNQAAFLRLSSDGAANAAIDGYLRSFKHHIELYPLESLDVQYIGEAVANDIISVNVWEDVNIDRCVHVIIVRKGRIIFIAKLQYYHGQAVEVDEHLRSKL